MYQPPHFREDDPAVLHALMREHPFGLLVTAGDRGLLANPVPFHLDTEASVNGTLRAHLAKANAQWRDIQAGAPVLAVFQGPDTYITPSWYRTKQETGKVVPTWNYVIVQARGMAIATDDAVWLRNHVGALTDRQEAGREVPWGVSDAPEDFVKAQLKGIVGIEIEITAMEGKWKVSQNRPIADREGVAKGLADIPDLSGMAGLVRQYGALTKEQEN
jgi:transcriptional regulator